MEYLKTKVCARKAFTMSKVSQQFSTLVSGYLNSANVL